MIRGFHRAVAIGIGLLAGCRAGEGERCICASDCKDGLSCVLENGAVLDEGTCSQDGAAGGGMCMAGGGEASAGDGTAGPPLFMDAGAKRDFEPPRPTSGSDTGTASGPTETGDTGTASSPGTGGGTVTGGAVPGPRSSG